ncbi:hypothetical protein [Citrobacter portucalensis]|uniref:Uncharacterized protein n=1 Tax=Citrobacter portucalensis TaxID=1639133 RepID=A0A9X4GQ40_9ENTR|nr:hypothetical protein [Citrobacter portucalensis]MDE9621635.1 hypothetical protein [Citrobacter portucalensis]
MEEQAKKYPDSDFFFSNKNYEKQLKVYTAKIKEDPLNRALKPTIGLSSSYLVAPLNNFTKKHLESIFSMRDIGKTFKTLSGMLHFTENEKDIVNQHANKSIGKKHYDRYDYIIEKRETTLKWEKAM